MTSYVSTRLQLRNLLNCTIIVPKIRVLLQFVCQLSCIVETLSVTIIKKGRKSPVYTYIYSLTHSFIHSFIHSFYNLCTEWELVLPRFDMCLFVHRRYMRRSYITLAGLIACCTAPACRPQAI
jgi:hypothetical protein